MVLVKIEHFGRIIESFPTLHRNHSKWMIDLTLHLKSEMLKVLEENIGFQVIGMNKTFWTGEKIVQRANKWGYMKSKCFCTPKDKTAPPHFIGRVNKQPTEREHIFASYTPEKKFMSTPYKEWKQIKYYKGKLPINK